MRKIAVTLAFAAATLVANAPAPANALPNTCTARVIGVHSGTAKCNSGTGKFRVALYCSSNPGTGLGRWVYGPWKSPGSVSNWACADHVLGAKYDRKN
ncbi:hypothetical protein GCM10022419_056720 [Nonomuraea rosea]|uniref:SH3 domain-containing protein n=1 Tax=Nonomuraea rosea TaxID=638574 RepID=A0ABP6XKZ4_9ACTN